MLTFNYKSISISVKDYLFELINYELLLFIELKMQENRPLEFLMLIYLALLCGKITKKTTYYKQTISFKINTQYWLKRTFELTFSYPLTLYMFLT